MEQVLQELIEFVKSASPLVWETLYRQVYVEALGVFLWVIGLVVAIVTLIRLAKWSKQQEDEDTDWEGFDITLYVASALIGVFAFGLLISVVKYIANPNYYAIKLILENINGG